MQISYGTQQFLINIIPNAVATSLDIPAHPRRIQRQKHKI